MTTRINRDGPAFTINARPTTYRAVSKPATSFESVLSASTLAAQATAASAVLRGAGAEASRAAAASSAWDAASILAVEGEAIPPTRANPPVGVPPVSSIEATLARQSQDAMFHLNLNLQDETRSDATTSSSPLSSGLRTHHASENRSGSAR